MTDIQNSADIDYGRMRRQIERAVGIASFGIGLALTLGSVVMAVRWRVRFGGFVGMRAFYLYEAWAFGTLELVAGTAMLRRWPVRWILELLPLVVPVVAYQYFILHFIFHRL